MTIDLDYIIEPQWEKDLEIKEPLQAAILRVALREQFEFDWMNSEMTIWASGATRETIFEKAFAQNIELFDGQFIQVWAAPFECQLEQKIRRVSYSYSSGEVVANKRLTDMVDVLVLFKHFETLNNGEPLDMEYYRTLNTNGFDREPGPRHMATIAAKYRSKYNEDLFSAWDHE